MKPLFALALSFVLLGCQPNIHDGVVVSKKHHDAYMTLIPIRSGNSTFFVPTHYPEQWLVYVQGVDVKTRKAGERSFQVSETEFKRLSIGDKFHRGQR